MTAYAITLEKANFSGIWLLNKTKSANLPQIFSTVDEYILTIKQDDQSITVSTEFSGSGQKIASQPDTFPIDGTAVEKEDRRGFKSKRSFRYGDDQHLVVTTEKKFTGEVQMANTNENEDWQLSDGGNTLTITITGKDDANQKQVRVFTKKP